MGMRRRGFLRALLLAPFVKPVAQAVWSRFTQPKVITFVMRSLPITATPMILGYKGAQFLETGVVYAPYLPLIQTCEIPPEHRKRWATAKFRDDYYETIRINGSD